MSGSLVLRSGVGTQMSMMSASARRFGSVVATNLPFLTTSARWSDEHVGDVAAAGHQLGDLALVDVVADHAVAGARELHRERQADVAESDDSQLRLLAFDLLQQFHSCVIRDKKFELR